MKKRNKKTPKIIKRVVWVILLFIVFLIVGNRMGWIGKERQLYVSVDEVQERTLTEFVTASGRIRPETEVKISPDVSGEIVELNVKEGDFVSRGDFLLKIKPDIYESALERAKAAKNSANANLANSKARVLQVQAQLNQIELSYNRNKTLYEQNVISESEYESVLASFESAKADLIAAKESVNSAKFSVLSAEAGVREAIENLRKTSVFAPIDGTVSLLNVEIGERVVGTEMMAGTEMLRIANFNSMIVVVDVSENDIVKVKRNDTADINVDAYINRTFTGIVTDIASSAGASGLGMDQVTNFEVKIRILTESYFELLEKSEMHPFRPGMSASVDIRTNTVYDAISVPLAAVTVRSVDDDGNNKNSDNLKEVVFIYKNGTVKKQVVETGIQDSYFIEITNGLKLEQKVVTAPFSLISRELSDGMEVVKVSSEELYQTFR